MFSKSKGKFVRIIAILTVVVAVIGILIKNIYSTTDNHYVLDVVKELATVNDDNLQVTEKIVKDSNAQYHDSKKLNYEVELKNIAKNENVETQVAIVVDTSYSMQVNDIDEVAKTKATELAANIMRNVTKSRVSISNNKNTKFGMTNYNDNQDVLINNYLYGTMNSLVYGEGNDCNTGLDNAVNSFTSAIKSGDSIKKYIVVFTDSTDNVADKMTQIDSNIEIISVLVDMTSTSYIVNNQPVRGDVYLINKDDSNSQFANIETLDITNLCNIIDKSATNIELTNVFSDEILNYFDISNPVASNGTVQKTNNGYKWNVDKIKAQEKETVTFTLELKTNIDINAGLIFEELCTNKMQDIKYNIDGNGEKTLNGADEREGTEATVIKICQGYDLKIKAVNESNTSLGVQGIEFKVIGTNSNQEEVCNLTKTTDTDGYITITADEARALRGNGLITYTVTPTVNQVGYSATDAVTFVINNNKETKKINWIDIGSTLEYEINEEKRLVDVQIPINSQRIDFELKVSELNNNNVVLSGAEFELIQPKLNNKYEMEVLSGTTDKDGIIHFSPTVMTKDGTYNYILRQISAPEGYEVTNLTLVSITYKNALITSNPSTQFNPNVVKSELCNDIDNHVLIEIGNECVETDPFQLKINVEDVDNGNKLEGITYLIRTINSNNVVRSQYETTDAQGQINAELFGNGNLRVEITEQSPKVGYIADTQTKELIINRNNSVITIWNASPTDLDKEQSSNKEDIIINLFSKKKPEQNIVRVNLVDSEEQDVPIGAGIVYALIDTETNTVIGQEVSNRNGELSFVVGAKTQGQHMYKLEVDKNSIPNEYSKLINETDIYLNLVYDADGYIIDENVTNGSQIVVEDHFSRVNNEDSVEYTAFVSIGYELDISNTVVFKIKLSDHEDLNVPINDASYDIDIEWNINGVNRTKTIKGRRTNSDGIITTYLPKGDDATIVVKERAAKVGYNIDLTTQEIHVVFNNNGTMSITQTPYDLGATNTDEPDQGAKNISGEIVFNHLNRKRTLEDTYLNLTINKLFTDGSVAGQLPIQIKSSNLLDKDGNILQLDTFTDNDGTVAIDFMQYIQDKINNNTIRVPGISELGEEIVYDLEINEASIDNNGTWTPVTGTNVKLRLIFRYKDGVVTLTNAETIYGNRLVKNKVFSSSSDSIEAATIQDTYGVFLANVTLDLYTKYDDIGNLSIDLKKINQSEEELNGAEYTLKVINPDNTVIRKTVNIKNGNDSSDIEISGLNVNVGSIIELTEKTAPIGYEINANTETLEVVSIDEDGEITLEQKDISYSPNRMKLEKKSSAITTSGILKTNYDVTFTDYELDVFKFNITAKDKNTYNGISNYSFKIDTDTGVTRTLTTEENGEGTVNVGGSKADNTITYTITTANAADYYKELSRNIKVNVVYDSFGKVDLAATQNAQTDSGYGNLWNIKTLNNSGFGEIGIEILLEHRDPLVVKVETTDKITNAIINSAEYSISESLELDGKGRNTINVGYVLNNGIKTYTLTQTNIQNSYKKSSEKNFTITYTNETITDANLLNAVDGDNISITGNKEVTIKIYVEPKVPFEFTNKYYFDTNIGLQGANFEVIPQNDEDAGTGTTDVNGKTAIYADIFGTNENIIYKVRQTKGAIGYATVEDFYVKVEYNSNREITSAILVNQYGEADNNRFVTISNATTSSYSNYNSNNKGIVMIEVLNYPEFKINIQNVDRRDGITAIQGTEYNIKSTYINSENSIIDYTQATGVITNVNGLGVAHLDKTKENTIVTYTVTEVRPATGYQSLGTEIKVIVAFDNNGYVSSVQVENDDNLNKIENVSKVNPIINVEDNFIVDLQLKNNPILKFKITAEDSLDHSTTIDGIGLQITSKTNDNTIYSNSSATNTVNQSGEPETLALTGSIGIPGYTEGYMDRTLDNNDMYYTIKEVKKASGYEWNGEDIIIKVSYDQDGKISATPVAQQGGSFVNIQSYDAENFEITIEIYNEEIKEFGIHLTTVDTYDKNKKVNNMKVEAFLTDIQQSSFVSDGKYELVDQNALLTGADRTNNGLPDITYGEDYRTIREYTEGAGTRTLRLTVKNDVSAKGYYLDSYDGTNSGKNVGYYIGNKYYEDAKYQNVQYQYLVSVTFDDDGKITGTELQSPGESSNIGWISDGRYIEVSHTDYKLNITMKFFPMLDLKLYSMDNYLYQKEIDKDGQPVALNGSKYTISTQRHTTGSRYKDEYVTAGYIGDGNYYGSGHDKVYGEIYEDTDELLVPIENDQSRVFYIFEEVEPTNYQKYIPRRLTLYEQRLVGIIQVAFDEYGEIDYNNSIIRKIEENTVEPYMNENGNDYLSNNNIKEYNYFYKHDLSKRDIDFYIGYALTTKINVTAIDDIAYTEIPNIRMYPFANDTYVTNTSYEYNTSSYRDTNNQGQFSIKYWGGSEQDSLNQYFIGSSRIGNNYNGYLFPADMAGSELGGSEDETDYFAKLDVVYDENGRISSVKSIGSDLWGDDNVDSDITWDSETGNINIKMLYSRKLQMSLNKIDYYDSTINKLTAKFDVISNKGLRTSINSKKTNDVSQDLVTIGKVYKDTTVKYTLSEVDVPDSYYPITDTIDFYVTFDSNGDIGTNTVKSTSDYFDVVNTSTTTKSINKTSPDITINIKNKPAFNLDIRVIDKFYKTEGIQNAYLNVTNDKGDVALGNPQTDANGYAKVITGPVYPGETVKYYIRQGNTADGYYNNSEVIELQVEFNDIGKVSDYKIISGNQIINNFDGCGYLNTRQISMEIMNMPKDLNIGLYKFDKTNENPISNVSFEITKENVSSGAIGTPKTITTNSDGYVYDVIDSFETSATGRTIKYTIHEVNTPASYRTMEDVVFVIRYNADGSIASANQIENANGILNTDVVPEISIGAMKKLNDKEVHFKAEVPNDNAYDVVIINEDENYNGLGIEGSKFDLSINGEIYELSETDVNGKTSIKDLTQNGEINIKVAQKEVGEGYREDLNNKIDIKLEKGADVYSLDLQNDTEGYIDDKNAQTQKAKVVVDEVHGIITITFKNESKTELTLIKQDILTKEFLEGAEFEVTAQQIDNNGNAIGSEIILTEENNKITNSEGIIYFDLEIAPQSQKWAYTFKEITPPDGYNAITDLQMIVTYDQYGRIIDQKSNMGSRLAVCTANENYNCRSMYAMIYNGDISPAYTVKVVTEDADTGKRINGSEIYLNITDEDGNLIEVEQKTPASINNGGKGITGNLGIDGAMHTDEEVDNVLGGAPIIAEKGLVYIDNIDYEGTINIEMSQTGRASGYVFGNQKTDGNIKIKARYIPQLNKDPLVEFNVIDNDGLSVIVDNTNRIITIKVLNESQVLFDITTKQYQSDPQATDIYVSGVNYNITSEIQTATESIPTDLNETTPLSDENGNTKGNTGSAYAGKTVVYTLHENISEKYNQIEDIQVEVIYDSKGYIKYYDLLTSEDNCYIDSINVDGRTIPLVVQNRKQIEGYTVYVEKHAMDTDEDTEAYGRTLQGAKYRITVEQQYNGEQYTTWTDVTNEEGLIRGLTFNGYGYITITLEELEAPEGYELDTTRFLRIYRNPDTGEMTKVDGNVNLSDTENDFDEFGNSIIKLIPINDQEKETFTLIINKISNATDKYITDNVTKFKAQIIRKDENENIIYQDEFGTEYTGINGKAIFGNLLIPNEAGDYKLVITEIDAPDGYKKLEEPVEIPIVIGKDDSQNSIIKSVDLSGLPNVSASKINKQLIGLNIGNDVEEVILDDEYSLDITKIDAETGNPIEDMAIFKVMLPDSNNTSVYVETMETLLGIGKLDYCFIEQDKDYQVRLSHMKLPQTDGELIYTFKEIKAPDGYSLIPENIELKIEFATDVTTGKMYIKNVTSSNTDYLKINTITPCSTDTRLEIDILNKVKQSIIHYDANDNGAGTIVPNDQIKEYGVDTYLDNTIPQRDGYIFAGWTDNQNSNTVTYLPGDKYSIDKDITLYAVWEEKIYLTSNEYNIVNADKQTVGLASLGRYKIEYDQTQEFEYNDGDKYITGILPQMSTPAIREEQKGTTVEKLINNLQTNADTIKVYKKVWDNTTSSIVEEEVNPSNLVGTAMRLELTKGTSQVISLELIVAGDVYSDNTIEDIDGNEIILSGDGILKQNDQIMVITQSNYKAQALSRSGMAFVVALDVDLDGQINQINSSTYLKYVPRKSTTIIKSLFPWNV